MSSEIQEEHGLPKSWAWTTLGEVCLRPQYGWTTSAATEGKLKLLRTTDITSGQIDWPSVPFCKDEPTETEKYLVSSGDIVISRAGSVGFSHLITANEPAVFASYLIRFKPLIDAQYLAYFLKSSAYWQSISESSIGIAVPNVNATKLKQVRFPVAPLPEQRRIVEKIEELFTQLDAGIDELRKAKAQLKRYRQAVLKAAVTGELTKEWRETHQDELEPASELLARILKERRTRWEADQLAKMEAAGKTPKTDDWKRKYKNPLPPRSNGCWPAQENWTWASIDQLLTACDYGTSAKTFSHTEGIPVLRMGNIVDGKLSVDQLKYLPTSHDEFPALLLTVGDMLFNRTNSAELVGKTAVYGGTPKPCSFASYLVRVTFAPDVAAEFMSYFLNSVFGRTWIASVVNQQVGQANVNATKLRAVTVPLPPSREQLETVAQVERAFSIADEVQRSIERELTHSERMRQSILKQAFEGKLVPQDPTDSPAELLLERIKIERAKVEAEKPESEKSKRMRFVKKRSKRTERAAA
jgi:type I restriction enzyme S subunit